MQERRGPTVLFFLAQTYKVTREFIFRVTQLVLLHGVDVEAVDEVGH
jgi:hypothetical protein